MATLHLTPISSVKKLNLTPINTPAVRPEPADYSIIRPKAQSPVEQGKNIVGAFGSSLKENLSGLGTLYGGSEQGIASKLGRNIQEAAGDIQKGNIGTGIAKAGFRTAGDVAGTIYAPVGAILGTLTGTASKLFPTLPKQYEKGINWAAKNVNEIPGVEKMFAYAVQNPQAEEDFGRAMNLLMASREKGQITSKGLKEVPEKLLIRPSQKALSASKELATSTAKKVTPDSAAIMQRVARINPTEQARFEKMAKQSVGEYLVDRNIYGNTDTILQKLYDRFSKSKGEADVALEKIPGEFKAAPVKTALGELYKREQGVSTPGALSPDFSTVRNLMNKYNKQGLNQTEINLVKRLYEKNVKTGYLKQNLPDNVARATNIDSAIRNWQVNQAEKAGLTNLPGINKETQLARQLLNDLGKKEAGMQGNNAIPLTDYILLAGGTPEAIAMYIAKKTLAGKGVQSSIARIFAPKATKADIKAIFGKPKAGFSELMQKFDTNSSNRLDLLNKNKPIMDSFLRAKNKLK